jgi:excisionase family DNA binding protein
MYLRIIMHQRYLIAKGQDGCAIIRLLENQNGAKNMLKDVDLNREYLSTPQAAEKADLSKVHIARLLRNKKLEGFQLGREWFVYADSLEKYLATPRKTGPKGPIKKKQAD